MLQQTRMEVVLPYYECFLEQFPTVAALARATSDAVIGAWSGLGYYRRARMLREGAIDIQRRFGGALPSDLQSLQTIAGIGRYTAGAIASIAYDRAAPIVDGNIARILSRLYRLNHVRDAWSRADELVRAASSPRIFNQALMEIGALICKPKKPQCKVCPLRAECQAFASGHPEALPPARKLKTRALHIPLYVVTDRRGRVLMRRESGRLMNGMLHLPHGNGLLFRGSRFAARGSRVGEFKHTITNRRVTFEVRIANREARIAGYIWVSPADLPTLPHPSYVRKALQLAGISKL
jgi:A/G-specific adenine glycosylase